MFGSRLKALREAKGWSQGDLAEASDMSQNGISQLETGRRQPSWEIVLKLSKALGVSCDAFAVEDGDENAVKARPGRPKKKAE
jgi:putative transcriptional regulator